MPYTNTTTEPADDTNSTDYEFTCDAGIYTMLSLGVYPMAVIVTMILAILTNRGKCCITKGGRPYCIYPINLLDGYKDRFGYACIFGAMTVQLIDVLLKGTTLSGAFAIVDLKINFDHYPLLSPFVTAVLLIINVALIVTAFYPLFICISTDYRLVGAVLGIICTIYRLGMGLWSVSQCRMLTTDYTGKYTLVKYNTLFYNAPSLICLAGLLAKFILEAVRCVQKRQLGFYPRPQFLAEEHHVLHVGRLLGPAPLPWHETDLHSVSIFNKQKFMATFVYKSTPYFQFPTRLVATVVILIAATYQIGLMVIFPVWSWFRLFQKASRNATDLENITGPLVASFLGDYIKRLEKWISLASDLWTATTFLTVGVSALYLYNASICYKKHIYRVYRGEKSMFPGSWARQASQNIMTNAVRYAGLQVAYFMWGFVWIQVALALIIFIIVYVVIMPIAEFHYYAIVITVAEIIIIPTLISMAIYSSQVILTRVLFMQPKLKTDDNFVPLAVNNRHVFYNFSLFYFFFNIFLGAVSAIMRVLKAMVLGIFFIPRIDRSIMMHGFEHLDGGFMSYLSVLTVIGTHDHPVVRVFLKLLWDGATDRKYGRQATAEAHSRSSRIARRNWLLAYTLLNNPDIIRYRKTNIKLEEVDHMARHRIVAAERKKTEGAMTSDFYNHAIAYTPPSNGCEEHQQQEERRHSLRQYTAIKVDESTSC